MAPESAHKKLNKNWHQICGTVFLVRFDSIDVMSVYPSLDASAVNRKTVLYVGGLEENVTETTLAAAFVPFGELTQVVLPKDATTSSVQRFFNQISTPSFFLPSDPLSMLICLLV